MKAVPDSPKRKPMSREEMITILETIARDPKQYPSSRVTAVRTLKEMQDTTDESVSELDKLDGGLLDEVTKKRLRRKGSR